MLLFIDRMVTFSSAEKGGVSFMFQPFDSACGICPKFYCSCARDEIHLKHLSEPFS